MNKRKRAIREGLERVAVLMQLVAELHAAIMKEQAAITLLLGTYE